MTCWWSFYRLFPLELFRSRFPSHQMLLLQLSEWQPLMLNSKCQHLYKHSRKISRSLAPDFHAQGERGGWKERSNAGRGAMEGEESVLAFQCGIQSQLCFREVEVQQHCDSWCFRSAYASHSCAVWNTLFLWVTFTRVYWDFLIPCPSPPFLGRGLFSNEQLILFTSESLELGDCSKMLVISLTSLLASHPWLFPLLLITAVNRAMMGWKYFVFMYILRQD